ncbi:MAG: GAF domain-containing protein [Magnetococcales bacterium]|nr:GAF domain-containing protein [Magnetococcales bacterium]
MDKLFLEEIGETKKEGDVLFPRNLSPLQLIITGPPGSGKTTILNAINGWPEEGYVDISKDDWWRSPVLANRPRELHFGVPFIGYEKAVPVYDVDSLDDSSYLEIDFMRVRLPPPKGNIISGNFRKKIVVEFILLPPKTLFELRKKRGEKGTHHVDKELTLQQVKEECSFYSALALYFHQSGMKVYVRNRLGGPPMRIKDESEQDDPFEMSIAKKRIPKKDIYHLHDQLRLRQRIMNRSWSARGNRELINLFARLLPEAADAERCNIFLSNPGDKDAWLMSGSTHDNKKITECRMWPQVNQVISSGEYMVHENLDKNKEFSAPINADGKIITLRNSLLVPIKSVMGDRNTGAIQLINKNNKRHFLEEDRLLLEKVARHLELAIENVYLRREMMDFSEILSNKAGNLSTLSKIILTILTIGLIVSLGINYYLLAPPLMELIKLLP